MSGLFFQESPLPLSVQPFPLRMKRDVAVWRICLEVGCCHMVAVKKVRPMGSVAGPGLFNIRTVEEQKTILSFIYILSLLYLHTYLGLLENIITARY